MYKRAVHHLQDYKVFVANPKNLEKVQFDKQFADQHKDKLVQRLKSMESVIDNQLKLLLYKEDVQNNDLYNTYSRYSYFKKLLMLMANKKILMDRSKRNNRQTAEILRMKSVTQSYYINDSSQYQVAKRMLKILDQEEFHDQIQTE